jgi:hypothetical protein
MRHEDGGRMSNVENAKSITSEIVSVVNGAVALEGGETVGEVGEGTTETGTSTVAVVGDLIDEVHAIRDHHRVNATLENGTHSEVNLIPTYPAEDEEEMRGGDLLRPNHLQDRLHDQNQSLARPLAAVVAHHQDHARLPHVAEDLVAQRDVAVHTEAVEDEVEEEAQVTDNDEDRLHPQMPHFHDHHLQSVEGKHPNPSALLPRQGAGPVDDVILVLDQDLSLPRARLAVLHAEDFLAV